MPEFLLFVTFAVALVYADWYFAGWRDRRDARRRNHGR